MPFATFLRSFEQSLNSRRELLVGIPVAVFGLLFFAKSGHLPYVINRWHSDASVSLKLVITIVNTLTLFLPALVVGYALGIALWKSVVTAVYVRSFARDLDIVIRPSHPDKAGGLAALGKLIFAMAGLLVVASLALSGIIFVSRYAGFPNTETSAKVCLAATLVLSVVMLVVPLFTSHQRMLAQRERCRTLLNEVAQQIDELEDSMLNGFRSMTRERREEILNEIKSLTALYNHSSHAPTWPFDRETILKFATPQVFSLLTLAGISKPIVEALHSLLRS